MKTKVVTIVGRRLPFADSRECGAAVTALPLHYKPNTARIRNSVQLFQSI